MGTRTRQCQLDRTSELEEMSGELKPISEPTAWKADVWVGRAINPLGEGRPIHGQSRYTTASVVSLLSQSTWPVLVLTKRQHLYLYTDIKTVHRAGGSSYHTTTPMHLLTGDIAMSTCAEQRVNDKPGTRCRVLFRLSDLRLGN